MPPVPVNNEMRSPLYSGSSEWASSPDFNIRSQASRRASSSARSSLMPSFSVASRSSASSGEQARSWGREVGHPFVAVLPEAVGEVDFLGPTLRVTLNE